MTQLLIGIIVGVGSMLAMGILYFILQRASNARADKLDSRCELQGQSLDETKELLQHERDAVRVLHENIDEHLKEISDLHSTNETLEARLSSVQKANDDLTRVLQDHPGALPAAIHGALERLRQEVSPAQGTAPAPAGGGADGRAPGPVHGGDDLEPP